MPNVTASPSDPSPEARLIRWQTLGLMRHGFALKVDSDLGGVIVTCELAGCQWEGIATNPGLVDDIVDQHLEVRHALSIVA